MDVHKASLNALSSWWMRVMFPGPPVPESPARDLRPRTQMLLLLGLLAATCALFMGRLDHPLLEPEEARYAEIPRQMLVEGRVWTPVLHGEDYWQKPPLLYWLVMLSYQIFGVHDWSARLIPALAGILCVILTTAWGWRTLGFWTGLVSGAVLTLSMRYLYLAGMLSMDGLLCTFVLASLAGGHLALTEERGHRRWLVLSALACGLGILTKGPVAMILIVVPLVVLALLDRRCRFLSNLEGAAYLAIVAALAGPWFALMTASAPEAAGSFVWLHHFVRYFAPLDHEKPAWFYLPSLLLGMLPWTLLLIPLVPYLRRQSQRTGKRRPAALGAFVLAFAWCVVFFSLSGCKRPGYILPALPLLALILGTFLTHGLPWQRWMQSASSHGHQWARRLTLTTFGVGVALSLAAGASRLWGWPAATLAALVFIGLAVGVTAVPMRAPAWTSWTACAVAGFLLLGFAQRSWLPDYHERFGLRRQVEISAAYEQEEELPIVTYPKRWDSVSFYSGRGNVESYAKADLAHLVYDLHKHGQAIVFVKREESLPDLLKALPDYLEVELLGREEDYVVVALVRRRRK